jgi:hypothetical protein
MDICSAWTTNRFDALEQRPLGVKLFNRLDDEIRVFELRRSESKPPVVISV